MPTVFVYGFRGKYTGSPVYDYSHPELNATHKCMLFLSQESDQSQMHLAGAECLKYGFGEYEFSRAGRLDIDSLNTDTFRGFSGYYEEALSQGSALVFYPNA
ncbi:MAG: hypothetical protein KA763_00810 [Xanthomonadales bacterium]|nr:hypothetical protein [Xanthomonadales bacterium]